MSTLFELATVVPAAMGVSVIALAVKTLTDMAIARLDREKRERAAADLSRQLREIQEKTYPATKKGEVVNKVVPPEPESEQDLSFDIQYSKNPTPPGIVNGPPARKPPRKTAPVVKHEATLPIPQQNQWVTIAISFLVLLSALFVILSNNVYDEGTKRWAYGAVGLVVGFWLNTKKH